MLVWNRASPSHAILGPHDGTAPVPPSAHSLGWWKESAERKAPQDHRLWWVTGFARKKFAPHEHGWSTLIGKFFNPLLSCSAAQLAARAYSSTYWMQRHSMKYCCKRSLAKLIHSCSKEFPRDAKRNSIYQKPMIVTSYLCKSRQKTPFFKNVQNMWFKGSSKNTNNSAT